MGRSPIVKMKTTRRVFLVHLGVTAAAVSGCGDDAGGTAAEASGPVAAGNVSAVPVGYLAKVGEATVILGRDTGGLYAMSSICTHSQCNIASSGTITTSGIGCSCHGSRFNTNGEVTQGPAARTLPHWKVDLATDGTITVQGGSAVDATVRTKVA
jgi:Rieske Fe-S protein